jgi:hypothetical protein
MEGRVIFGSLEMIIKTTEQNDVFNFVKKSYYFFSVFSLET